MKKLPVIALLSVVLLTGCVTREQADEKLAKACVSAAEVFMEEGFVVKKIKNRTFGEDRERGPGYREVRVTAFISDEWLNVDKEYRCIFAEDMGPFGLSYSADLYQLKFDDEVYGKDGDQIVGSLSDINKMTNAVNTALGQ